MRKFILMAFAASAFSCVTPSVLEEWEMSTIDRLQRLESDTITRAQYKEEARATRMQLEDEIADTVGRIGPITGNPLIDLIGTVLIGAAGTYVGVNKARDHRRAVRGEPIANVPGSAAEAGGG